MRQPKGVQCHGECAATDRRSIPNITGDQDMDRSIMKCKDKDVPDRLKLYVGGGYGPRTGYNGYQGYHGDD